MADWIDLMGSFIIGSMVMLMLTTFNSTVSSTASENLIDGVTQRQIVSSSTAIEDDFYKMGFRATGEKISVADSCEIKFCGDLGNDGSLDTVRYYLGDIDELSGTPNPNDRYLYRTLNSNEPQSLHIITDFNLSYFDSLSQPISFSDLTNAAGRARVKTVRVLMIQESQESVEDNYALAEFEKTIRPKNL
ncbi:MAG TPA: hypothetical protein VLB50_07505 [Ignavibacteriaceae bacterium]|nr:hypothetical protein [Ignavibacteriaceae bacterium]